MSLNPDQFRLFDPGPATPMYGPDRNDLSPVKHRPFSGADEYSRVMDQVSLPNAIPVRGEISPGAALKAKPRHDEFMEVPYNQLSTAQWGVRIDRMNEVWNGEKLPRDGYATQRPLAHEFTHPTDPSQNHYMILDGNHRATTERHKGAMFVPVKVNRSLPMRNLPPETTKGKGYPGTFNP